MIIMEAKVVIPSAVVLEPLNQDNYEKWSVQLQTYLLAKDLWDVVESTTEAPMKQHGEAKFKVWRKNDAKALHAIQISCTPDTFSLISDKRTAKSAWDTLEAKFKLGCDNIPNNICQYRDFLKAVKSGDLDTTKDFLANTDGIIRAKITYSGKTALHTAVAAGHLDIVKELVNKMEKEDLEIKGDDGKTALIVATNKGDIEMVKCMVRKNKKLVSIASASNRLPVVLAFRNSYWDLASYLYSVTPHKDLSPEEGPNGATLVSQCFYAKKFDIAWDLIQRYPALTITKDLYGVSPLYALAGVPSAFLSGERLRFWQHWIYQCHVVAPSEPAPRGANDHFIDVQNSENGVIKSDERLERGLVWYLRQLLGINRIYEMKLNHCRSEQFLKYMCEKIKDLNKKEMQDGMVQASIFRAVERGIPEFIKRICQVNRELVWSTNDMGRSIFHYAIECRQEKIYNLIWGLDMKNAFTTLTDESNNSMLHMAAFMSPSARFNHISGAALQMQRELQWFKEVEAVVPKKFYEIANSTDYMTPRDLFTKNHKNLLNDGEKWMRDTATSFSVVGALIVTIMFATAFTVPGGNDQITGFPIFINERLFMVFILSDAISLFSATTSSLIFLGILTSRYAEDDFFRSLPIKMVIGLLTLFFSITTMMIAFCAAVLVTLKEKPWTVFPIIFLSSIPVTLFAAMKIRLFWEILTCTTGVGIFKRKVEMWLQIPDASPKRLA